MSEDKKHYPGNLYKLLDSYFDILFGLLQKIQKDIDTTTDSHEKDRLQTRFNDIKIICDSIIEEKVDILTRSRLHLIKPEKEY